MWKDSLKSEYIANAKVTHYALTIDLVIIATQNANYWIAQKKKNPV